MARFARIRSVASAIALAAITSLVGAAAVLAGSGGGPFPR
jgi:hypothetical protein